MRKSPVTLKTFIASAERERRETECRERNAIESVKKEALEAQKSAFVRVLNTFWPYATTVSVADDNYHFTVSWLLPEPHPNISISEIEATGGKTYCQYIKDNFSVSNITISWGEKNKAWNKISVRIASDLDSFQSDSHKWHIIPEHKKNLDKALCIRRSLNNAPGLESLRHHPVLVETQKHVQEYVQRVIQDVVREVKDQIDKSEQYVIELEERLACTPSPSHTLAALAHESERESEHEPALKKE